MTQPTPAPAATHTRCSHRFAASGRQCRLLTSDPSGLCVQHLAKKKSAAQNADFAKLLFSHADGFQTAQGINHSLTRLYELLARDRISVRRAHALAYITSLILRTLPAIDHDKETGFSDAFAAKISVPAAAPDTSATGSAIPEPPAHTKPS